MDHGSISKMSHRNTSVSYETEVKDDTRAFSLGNWRRKGWEEQVWERGGVRFWTC